MRLGPKTLLAAALRFRYRTAFTFSKISTIADARKARAESRPRGRNSAQQSAGWLVPTNGAAANQ